MRTPLITLYFLLFFFSISAQTTYMVDDDGNGDYETVLEALQFANSGDVIIVTGGVDNVHTEANIFVDKDITIRGSSPSVIMQAGTGPQTVFQIRNVFTLENAAVVIEDMTVRYGFQEVGGAIAMFSGDLQLNNVIVRDNTASQGGGIYVEYGATLTATQCQIINNGFGLITPFSGGGIHVGGVANLIACTIDGNTATDWGGGAAFAHYDPPGSLSTVVRSTISNNSASAGKGGGIYTEHPLAMENSTISGNTSALEGGGIAISAIGSLTSLHLTIAQNNSGSDGGGVHVAPFNGNSAASINLLNTIIADNTASGQGADLFLGGNLNVNQHNLVESCAGGCPTFLFTADPNLGLLTDNGGFTETHALQFPSAAINQADQATSLPTDQTGFSRTNCPDIGAFELPGVPESSSITVQSGGAAVNNGSTTPSVINNTDFGAVEVNEEQRFTFTINNTGCAALELTNDPTVFIQEGPFSVFSIVDPPASPINPFASRTFEIRFTPIRTESYSATVVIPNNDVDSDPFTFVLAGRGIAADMEISGNGDPIEHEQFPPEVADGTDFGSANVQGETITRTFLIENLGEIPLQLDGTPVVQILQGPGQAFSVIETPATFLHPGASTTFAIEFDPADNIGYEAEVVIQNTDPFKDPYVFSIQGVGGALPDIAVSGNAVDIENGDDTPSLTDGSDFGAIVLGSTAVSEFTITNDGLADLTGLNYNLIGPGSSNFSISSGSFVPLAPGEERTFTISFTPLNAGTWTAIARIFSNDPDENPFTFTVAGSTLGPKINITGLNGNTIQNGDANPTVGDGTDFGVVELGDPHLAHTFSIENQGTDPLELIGNPFVRIVDVGGGPSNAFSLGQAPTSPIPQNDATSFTINFGPINPGVSRAIVSIESNDSEESLYSFHIVGFAGSSPELDLSGNGLEIESGDDTPQMADLTDFGAIRDRTTHRFSMTNNGSGDLMIGNINISSSTAGVFEMTNGAGARIRPGKTRELAVRFRPQGVGRFDGLVSIESNDVDENPYTFQITGAGLCTDGPGGDYFHWTNEGGDQLWSNPLNWRQRDGSNGLPNTNDIVYFGCDVSENCTIDIDAEVAEFIIHSSYGNGVVSLGGQTLTINTEVIISGSNQFDPGAGLVRLKNISGKILVQSDAPFQDLLLDLDELKLKQPLQLLGGLQINDLTKISGPNSNTRIIRVAGNVVSNVATYEGKGTIVLNGEVDQHLSGLGSLSHLTINKSDGQVLLDNSFRLVNGTLSGDGQLSNNRLILEGDYTVDFAGSIDELELDMNVLKLKKDVLVTGNVVVSSLKKMNDKQLLLEGSIISPDPRYNGSTKLHFVGDQDASVSGPNSFQPNLTFIVSKEDGALLRLASSIECQEVIVEAGTLDINNRILTGDLTVESNASLIGSGQLIGKTTIAGNGNLIPGYGPTSLGTLNFAKLTLEGNANLEVDMEANSLDQITFTQNLRINGANFFATAETPPTTSVNIIYSSSNRRIRGEFANAQQNSLVQVGAADYIADYSPNNRRFNLLPAANNLSPLELPTELENLQLEVIKKEEVTKTSQKGLNWRLFPNPVKDRFFLQSAAFESAQQLELYDVQGRRLWVRPWLDKQQAIDVSALPQGIYFLRFRGEVQRLIKL